MNNSVSFCFCFVFFRLDTCCSGHQAEVSRTGSPPGRQFVLVSFYRLLRHQCWSYIRATGEGGRRVRFLPNLYSLVLKTAGQPAAGAGNQHRKQDREENPEARWKGEILERVYGPLPLPLQPLGTNSFLKNDSKTDAGQRGQKSWR